MTRTLPPAVDPRIQDLLDRLDSHGVIDVPVDTFTDPIGSLVIAVDSLLALEADVAKESVRLAHLLPEEVLLIPDS